MWLDMPWPHLQVYLSQLQVVHARRQLDMVEAIALGTGSLPSREHKTVLRALRDRAGIRPQPVKLGVDQRATLAMIGVGVVIEPPPERS